MDFDKDSQEFILSAADRNALGTSLESTRWPMKDLDGLLEKVTVAQARVDDIDLSQFPYGSDRHTMNQLKVSQSETLRGIRAVIVRNVTIDDATLDQLLQGPSE